MRIKRSIERKVFLSFGGLTFLVGLTFSVVSLIIAFTIEDSILEKILAHEANVLSQEIVAGKTNPVARLDYMAFYSDLANAPKDIREARQEDPRITEVFSDASHHYHLVDVEVNQRTVGWLIADVTQFLSVSSQSSDLLQVAIVLLSAAILLSLWLAYRIALKTTKPITSLAHALEQQAENRAELDITEFKSSDEIEYLATTIETALSDLRASFQRESDFNRDLSHELRTPLTVINNTLALTKKRALNERDRHQLNDSADKITSIVKTLLALARSETLPLETIRLRAIMEESALLFEQQLSEHGFEILLNIPERAEVKASPELLMLLSNNLIENALNYSTDKQLTIALNHSNLSFSNQSSIGSIENAELITQPNIKQQDSKGIGQGLYLVNRIAHRLGWTMSVNTEKSLYQVSFKIKP